LNQDSAKFVSVPTCLGLAVLIGVLGMLLLRVVPHSEDNEYLQRYAAWAREVKAQFETCGKHEPRDPECVRRHPVREKP
jgi:hypothetical protein